jgi:hypothetical protein
MSKLNQRLIWTLTFIDGQFILTDYQLLKIGFIVLQNTIIYGKIRINNR